MTKIPITWIFDYLDALPDKAESKNAIRDLIVHLYKRMESEDPSGGLKISDEDGERLNEAFHSFWGE